MSDERLVVGRFDAQSNNPDYKGGAQQEHDDRNKNVDDPPNESRISW